MRRPCEETRRQPRASLKLRFEPAHLTSVGLVIVSQEVQEPVERQNAPFCGLGMPETAGLPGRNPAGNRYVPEGRNPRKRQDIGGLIDTTVCAVQPAYLAV